MNLPEFFVSNWIYLCCAFHFILAAIIIAAMEIYDKIKYGDKK